MNGRWALVVVLLLVLSPACSSGEGSPRADETADEATDLPNLTFVARISADELRQAGSEQDVVFAGKWKLSFEGRHYRLEGASGASFGEAAWLTPEGLEIDADPAPLGAFNCLTDDGERAAQPGSASGLYEFELAADALTLVPVEEPCSFRELILDRGWTRTD